MLDLKFDLTEYFVTNQNFSISVSRPVSRQGSRPCSPRWQRQCLHSHVSKTFCYYNGKFWSPLIVSAFICYFLREIRIRIQTPSRANSLLKLNNGYWPDPRPDETPLENRQGCANPVAKQDYSPELEFQVLETSSRGAGKEEAISKHQ